MSVCRIFPGTRPREDPATVDVYIRLYAFIETPPRSHCLGLTVLHISRHGIDICFQQESLCSRRQGLTTKPVSRLECISVFSGNTQNHAAAGRLYTTRDDLTHLLVEVIV